MFSSVSLIQLYFKGFERSIMQMKLQPCFYFIVQFIFNLQSIIYYIWVLLEMFMTVARKEDLLFIGCFFARRGSVLFLLKRDGIDVENIQFNIELSPTQKSVIFVVGIFLCAINIQCMFIHILAIQSLQTSCFHLPQINNYIDNAVVYD